MPPDDQPNPSTLRPVPAPPGIGADPTGADKPGQQELVGYYSDRYRQALASQQGQVRDGSDGPERLVSSGGTKGINEDTGAIEMTGGTTKWVPFDNQDPLKQLWYQAQQEAEDLKLGDYLGGAGAGAARSYVDTEGAKQDEVTRQFKDFLARAKGTYDLMDSERSYAMAGDDQNIQNQTAMRAGNLNEAWATPYADVRGPGLSSVIRPSLPNYLSPDYRMNDAVGLGGGEGFNDPQYDEYGMPLYATGTDPMSDPALANIPPDLLAMVGQPLAVPPDGSPPSGKPWPWGRRVA